MKVLNSLAEDYHIHSLNFSDGMNTVDEIVQYAPKIGLKEITITDHSQATLDANNRNIIGRWNIKRRENVHNKVKVNFGVEGDLLNNEGDCCFDIQGLEGDFLILSCHPEVFKGDLKDITQGYINAIERYHDKINCIGHLCNQKTSEYIDVKAIVAVANKYRIPIEFNCAYFNAGKTDMKKLDLMFSLVDQVYVNSDAHTLNHLGKRKAGFDYLKEQGYVK